MDVVTEEAYNLTQSTSSVFESTEVHKKRLLGVTWGFERSIKLS